MLFKNTLFVQLQTWEWGKLKQYMIEMTKKCHLKTVTKVIIYNKYSYTNSTMTYKITQLPINF